MSTIPEITPIDPGDRAALVETLAQKLYETGRQRTIENGAGVEGHKFLNWAARTSARRMSWEKASEKTRDDNRALAEAAIEHMEAIERAKQAPGA